MSAVDTVLWIGILGFFALVVLGHFFGEKK